MVSRGKKFSLIIEKNDISNNKVITELDLCNYLKSNESTYVYWSFILHDKDINEMGELKREHYHLILCTNNIISTKSILNDIVKHLFINPSCVSINRYDDIVKSVQYLIHQNDKDKYQYDLLDIWTNNTNEMMSILFNSVSTYEVDIEYLIKLVDNCDSVKQVYRQLGLNKSKEYRSIICDLWREKYIK